jgi:ferrous iron transport protein A
VPIAYFALLVKNQTHRQAIPLKHLPVGHRARIARVTGHPDHVHRLAEFGLRGGTTIEMFRPGNPCIIRLAGHKVCLRANDLLHVLVEPAAG